MSSTTYTPTLSTKMTNLAMACRVLREIHRISGFLDAGTDDTGLLLDRKSLPKRIERKRTRKSSSKGQGQATTIADSDDEEGVGF